MNKQINKWTTPATAQVWRAIGTDLHVRVVDAIGPDASRHQLGAIFGKLLAFGENELVKELTERINQHNEAE